MLVDVGQTNLGFVMAQFVYAAVITGCIPNQTCHNSTLTQTAKNGQGMDRIELFRVDFSGHFSSKSAL
jgi:hypothetical protein